MINVIKMNNPIFENKIIKLKGLLKGISVDESDIKEAKKSLFKGS